MFLLSTTYIISTFISHFIEREQPSLRQLYFSGQILLQGIPSIPTREFFQDGKNMIFFSQIQKFLLITFRQFSSLEKTSLHIFILSFVKAISLYSHKIHHKIKNTYTWSCHIPLTKETKTLLYKYLNC